MAIVSIHVDSSEIRSDHRVVGVQYGKAMGMRVIAIDGGDEKRKLCIDQLGAEKYIDFQQEKDIPGKVMEWTKVRQSGCSLSSGELIQTLVWCTWSDCLLCSRCILRCRTERCSSRRYCRCRRSACRHERCCRSATGAAGSEEAEHRR